MTFIEEKILDIKASTAAQFNISVKDLDIGFRNENISNARKCFALLMRKHLPELKPAEISKKLGKHRGLFRCINWKASLMYEQDESFRKKVDLVDSRLIDYRKSCYYCKTILK